MAIPGKVLNLTAIKVRNADGSPSVRLKWDHLLNTGGVGATPIPYYEIQRTGVAPTTILITTVDDHDGRPAFIAYLDSPGIGASTYVVRGVNAEGSGVYSDPASATIAVPGALTAVVVTEVIRADGKVGVQFALDYKDGVTGYRFTRQDTSGPVSYTLAQPGLAPSNRRLLYQDFFVVSPDTYTYTLRAVDGTLLGTTSSHTISLTAPDGGVPGNGGAGGSYTGGISNPGVVRWSFKDVWGTGGAQGTYIFEINPNEGGSPSVTKNINMATNVGPNRGGVLQEGQNTAPILSFSGLIITQSHYEALETWFDKKILIELKDDLGRTFRGVFSAFEPTRSRRPYNPWFHTYTAQFTCYGYKNASGQIRYGRF